MGKIEDAKIIGGIGSLLFLLGGMGALGKFSLFSIVGLIMMAIAIKYISDEVREPAIFNNFLYFLVVSIVGLIIGSIIGLASFFQAMFIGKLAIILSILALLIIFWIVSIVSSIFLRRSFELVATKTGNSMFSTAGKLYFIGAILLIIFIGLLIIFVALILTVIAFFSLSPPKSSPQMPSQPSVPV
ncbi:MAG: DUF996 domain-containing protein [Fervidicoccaceae archaeon]